MSQKDVEILRLLIEAFNRRDIDDALRYMDPKVELYPGILAPDQPTRYLGCQGVKDFFLSATEPWETVTVEPKETIDLAGNRILLIDWRRFRGRNAIEIDNELPPPTPFETTSYCESTASPTRPRLLKPSGCGR